MADEGMECLGTPVTFRCETQPDIVLERFGNRQMITEMEKVFFADGPNALGHSYAGLMSGPGGRNDLQDVIALLRAEPWTKRAVLTLCGPANGKVPCLNVIQFLQRGSELRTIYFARGQDVFRKFYADGLCVASMARTVARGLGVQPGVVTGFIGSSHIYHTDRPAIDKVLTEGKRFLAANNDGVSARRRIQPRRPSRGAARSPIAQVRRKRAHSRKGVR